MLNGQLAWPYQILWPLHCCRSHAVTCTSKQRKRQDWQLLIAAYFLMRTASKAGEHCFPNPICWQISVNLKKLLKHEYFDFHSSEKEMKL